MGKVTYSPGIEYINGALAKPKKQDGHKCGDYLIGTHRTAPTTNTEGCTRIYLRKATSYERTTPLSSNELDARARFAAVRQMIIERKADLMKITQDQAAFRAQKDNVDGKKTMNAYYWLICGAEYDAAHPRG